MSLSSDLIERLFLDSTVCFDNSSQNNGLYICMPSSSAEDEAIGRIVADLKAGDAWHGELKHVAAEMKGAYSGQLQFEECFAADVAGNRIVVLKAGHAKYPTSTESWEKWRSCLTGR